MTPEVYSATLKYLWKNVYEMTVNNFLLNDQNNAGIVGPAGCIPSTVFSTSSGSMSGPWRRCGPSWIPLQRAH